MYVYERKRGRGREGETSILRPDALVAYAGNLLPSILGLVS